VSFSFRCVSLVPGCSCPFQRAFLVGAGKSPKPKSTYWNLTLTTSFLHFCQLKKFTLEPAWRWSTLALLCGRAATCSILRSKSSQRQARSRSQWQHCSSNQHTKRAKHPLHHSQQPKFLYCRSKMPQTRRTRALSRVRAHTVRTRREGRYRQSDLTCIPWPWNSEVRVYALQRATISN
jgi:hypothetical protein